MFKHKIKTLLLIVAVLCAFSAWFWARSQHNPTAAIRVASNFVNSLHRGDLESAYELTVRTGDVGSSFKEFSAIADREWFGHIRAMNISDIRTRAIFPFQSNGNRLRRRLSGRFVEMPVLTIDFLIESKDGLRVVPFEVRCRYGDDGQWKVSYFQAHAL